MVHQNSETQYTYQPLNAGSPIGGMFFFLIGFIGVALEAVLFFTGTGTLRATSALGEMIFLGYSFLFTVLGATILFYRKKYVFDRTTGKVIPILRLPFLSIRLRAISYRDIDAVQISRRVLGSGSNVSLLFFLSLVQDDKPDIVLERFDRYSNIKRVSELLSLALMKPLHDNSSGRIVVKQPREFNRVLQAKLMSNTDIMEEALKPRNMESVVSESPGKMNIRIPPFGILDALITLLIPSLILFLSLAWISFMALHSLPFEIIAYSLTIPVVFIVVAGSYLFREEYIDVNNHDLILYWTFAGFHGTRVIPIQHLEGLYVIGREDEEDRFYFLKLKTLTRTEGRERRKDVFYPFRCLSSSLTARGPKKSLTFGRAIDIEELAYLEFLIKTFVKNGNLKRT